MRSWTTRLGPAWRVASIPAYSILLAFIVAGVVILVSSAFSQTGFDPLLPLAAYWRLLVGAFGSFNGIANTLVAAAPLMFGGLAVGLGLKAGLFNIGVAGQFLVGAFAAAVIGASLADAPTAVAMPLAVLGALAVGSLAAFADFTNALGTGTGILLSTLIIYNLYEDIAAKHMEDMHPAIRKIMGG